MRIFSDSGICKVPRDERSSGYLRGFEVLTTTFPNIAFAAKNRAVSPGERKITDRSPYFELN